MRVQLAEDISTGGGRTVGYTYDSLNRVVSESASAASGGYDVQYTYDVVGNRTQRIISANGQCMQTDYVYNDRDQLLKETHIDPGVCFYLDNKPVHAYASNGDWYVIKQTVLDDLLDDDYIDSLDYVSTTEYEGNRRKSVTDDRGFTTSFTYDTLGRIIETKNPSVDYIDSNDNPQTGNLYTYTGYDSLGRKEWQTEPTDNTGALDDTDGLRWLDNAETEYWDYDELGRVKVHIDFKEQATGYFYNNRGQLQYKCYYDFDGTANGVNENYNENNPDAGYTTRVIYTYDNLGRQKTVTDARGTTTYHYDIEGRIEQIDTPEGTINYEYNLITGSRIRTYSDNTDTDYFYDRLGRLETVQTADEEITYGYDAAGNRIWMGFDLDVSTGFEIETDYTYNSINRLTELVHQDTTGQLASYSYDLAADGQRVSLDEEIKLTGGSTETHEITYGYDNINRLTGETAESGDDGYDVYYEYDVVGNRTLREITVNSQPFTTEYEYYDGTDKLKTETQCGASCMLDIGDERYYAYAKQNGRGFYYRDSNGNKIGSLYAFMIGLPSVWSRYLFILVMAMVPVLLFGAALKRLLLCYGEPTRLRLRVPKKSICVLLAFLIFIGPDGFESLAQAEMQYSELGASSWGQADRTIEYTYDDNGSLLTKTTKVTSTSEVIETVTNHYNLANRLDKVTTELANGDQHIVEYTYNDEGIRVRAYSYDIPYGQGVQNEKTVIYLVDAYNHTGYAQTLEELAFNYADPDPLTETPDSLTTYLIGDDVLAQNVDGDTQYLLYDGHGSTRQLAEYDSGTNTVSIADSFSYDAYGVLLQNQADIFKPGYTQQQQTNLLYSGEYFDTDVQQYYLRARWYNQLNGIFNRIDPYSGNNYDPISLHKYLYCHADPVNNIDPSGSMLLGGGSYSLTEIVMISAMMGMLTGMITYHFTGSISSAILVGAAFFVMTFIGLGGIAALKAAFTGATVTSPHLLNPQSWQDAEKMLSKVLRTPKNTLTYFVEGMSKGRRPDFILKGHFIADSKWWTTPLYKTPQLVDLAKLATDKEWKTPLYIFVREGTKVYQPVVKLVESTGGKIIRIFR